MKIDWSKISHGASFETLCTELLQAENDPSVKSYRREGRDGGIDAMSDDGKTVYQFKFHKSNGSIISDTNEELKKIKSIKIK